MVVPSRRHCRPPREVVAQAFRLWEVQAGRLPHGSLGVPMPATFQANKLRQTVLRMAHLGATAHVACAFSLIEILAVLYRNHLNLGTSGPHSPDRDYLVLSKG